MTSLINKLADWPPNYHETATAFPQIFCTPHSLNKPTLNKPAKNGSRGGDVSLWHSPFGSAIDLKSVLITTDRMAAPMHQSTQSPRPSAKITKLHCAKKKLRKRFLQCIVVWVHYACTTQPHKVPEQDSRVLTGATVAQGTVGSHNRRWRQCPRHCWCISATIPPSLG